MSHYKHITPEEREKILILRSKNYTITDIATSIGRNKATISRELMRNSVDGNYSAVYAQSAYEKRRNSCRPKKKLSDPLIFNTVREKFLDHQWSPEQIAERIKHECASFSISCTTIYRGIYAGLFDTAEERRSDGNRGARRKLRHRGKTRHTKDHNETRGKIVISNDLSERPTEANDRSRIGDWEGDTVAGKNSGPCLVTLADRMSRFLLSRKAEKKNSIYVRDTMIQCLQGQPLHSITPDRGKEFARHAEVTAALNNVLFYFPQPHQPWQRGTNENTNGLLREYFPKGTDLSKYSDEQIQSKVDELNKRPRKCLGYRTPYEVYYSTTLHLI
jgi:IS30 family transposase